MISDYVMTESHCRGQEKAADAIGLASYNLDSHNCQRLVKNGRVENEGDLQVPVTSPYPIAYRAIVPRRAECENLLVPVCLSASHIAYGSIRMEPVFMILGQSAAVAAGLALERNGPVQNVDIPRLQAKLRELGQVLEWKGGVPSEASAAPLIAASSLPGLVLDDADGKKTGTWTASQRAGDRKVGTGYVHDGNTAKGSLSIA